MCAISRNSLIGNDLRKLVRAISRKYLTVNDLQKSGRPKSLIYNDLRKLTAKRIVQEIS